jgi:hypothetical protein
VAWQTRLREERKKRRSVVCLCGVVNEVVGDDEATKMPRKKLETCLHGLLLHTISCLHILLIALIC